MRESLKDLIKNTILFRFSLPREGIQNSKISTCEDACYRSSSDESFADIIYNAVVEYSFNEYEICESDFDTLHRRALISRLNYNQKHSEKQRLKYGFYGEIILYCMLYIFYEAPPVIARGHFYQVLENSETKGYDAYHLIDNNGQAELWFGEVKFYKDFAAATTGNNGAVTNLAKTISDDYLNTNLIAISERINDLALENSILSPILTDMRANPEVTISELSKKYSLKLVYPILILFEDGNKDYEDVIQKAIGHIETNSQKIEFDLSLDVSLFFIFSTVEDTIKTKYMVLKWINEKKPLMS